MKSLSKAREHTTKRLTGMAVPDCFADATVASAVAAYSRETKSARAARRRLVSKVDRLNAGGVMYRCNSCGTVLHDRHPSAQDVNTPICKCGDNCSVVEPCHWCGSTAGTTTDHDIGDGYERCVSCGGN